MEFKIIYDLICALWKLWKLFILLFEKITMNSFNIYYCLVILIVVFCRTIWKLQTWLHSSRINNEVLKMVNHLIDFYYKFVDKLTDQHVSTSQNNRIFYKFITFLSFNLITYLFWKLIDNLDSQYVNKDILKIIDNLMNYFIKTTLNGTKNVINTKFLYSMIVNTFLAVFLPRYLNLSNMDILKFVYCLIRKYYLKYN